MRSSVPFLAFLAVLGAAAQAHAGLLGREPGSNLPGTGMHYPGAPRPVYQKPASPYPMNYADEAAETLGIKNGRMDVFAVRPVHNDALTPSVSGGVDGRGAMLRLQWHPGE